MQQAPSRRSWPKLLKIDLLYIIFRWQFSAAKIAPLDYAGRDIQEGTALKPNEWRETYTTGAVSPQSRLVFSAYELSEGDCEL
jgi:hypothetical protein